MSEVFVISDTHFGHANMLKFTNDDGSLVRDFSTVMEMDVTMIERWNSIVTPRDKVYHLGDVAFTRDGLHLMHMLNGKKRLVRGNHDLMKTSKYFEYFDEIYGVRQINGLWLTHVPMHPDGVDRPKVKANIHGHLHNNVIDHEKYVNVSVERINYTPVSLDTILEGL